MGLRSREVMSLRRDKSQNTLTFFLALSLMEGCLIKKPLRLSSWAEAFSSSRNVVFFTQIKEKVSLIFVGICFCRQQKPLKIKVQLKVRKRLKISPIAIIPGNLTNKTFYRSKIRYFTNSSPLRKIQCNLHFVRYFFVIIFLLFLLNP